MRDLAWACFSEPLIFAGDLGADEALVDASFALTPQRRAWLEAVDRQPEALLQHLSQKRSHRLGIYFESLWQFFLRHDPAVDLIAHNLPVHHEGRTLGEFDCLYFCHERQQVVHLELAVKFFLGHHRQNTDYKKSHTSSAQQWLGPDAKDRLDLKLAHLLQRQTRLSDTPAAINALQALNVTVGCKEVAVKGYLFAPNASAMPPPPAFNAARTMHTWLTCGQALEALPTQGDEFALLEKMQWLGPAQIEDPAIRFTGARMAALIDAHFSKDAYPIMIASLDAFGLEKSRCFITHDTWPESPQV